MPQLLPLTPQAPPQASLSSCCFSAAVLTHQTGFIRSFVAANIGLVVSEAISLSIASSTYFFSALLALQALARTSALSWLLRAFPVFFFCSAVVIVVVKLTEQALFASLFKVRGDTPLSRLRLWSHKKSTHRLRLTSLPCCRCSQTMQHSARRSQARPSPSSSAFFQRFVSSYKIQTLSHLLVRGLARYSPHVVAAILSNPRSTEQVVNSLLDPVTDAAKILEGFNSCPPCGREFDDIGHALHAKKLGLAISALEGSRVFGEMTLQPSVICCIPPGRLLQTWTLLLWIVTAICRKNADGLPTASSASRTRRGNT